MTDNVRVEIVGGALDHASWALAQRTGNSAGAFIVRLGEIPPDWWWEAIADGRIVVTNARFGDLNWGAEGVDVLGPAGVFHVPLGGDLREDQLKSAEATK